MTKPPDLHDARLAVRCASEVIDAAITSAKQFGSSIDDQQNFLYDLSHAAAGLSMCRTALDYAVTGDDQAHLAMVFIGRVVAQLGATLWTAHEAWGVQADALESARTFATSATSGEFVAAAAALTPASGLSDDLEMVSETFRRFGEDKIAPHAERIHREDLDIPREIIEGVADLGCFGLSISEEYGESASGTEDDHLAMIIATEELSRVSLGAGGSLITRPEILARALESGGTEAQKRAWLPAIASGEMLCAVAVTEPDFGSDVSSLNVTAAPVEAGYLVNGTKTWCTFAGQATALMLLARTDADPSSGHRGLSLLVVEKPTDSGHHFRHEARGGTLEGRAIPTLGYRGMHSFEVNFSDWFVPETHLIGGADGLGRGFYLQMAGFENGRIQTAARSVGLMQRAYELAQTYAADRRVFDQTLDEYQLTQSKLGTMLAIIEVSRQHTYNVARSLATGAGATEAAMAKAFMCKAAEWVTRESMQIHGGYGYAEEFEVSRLFVDARVLSIFEGTDETLCLKLIARKLLS